MQALLLGAGLEVFIRSGIYTGREGTRGKDISFWGPYKALERLQTFLLSRADGPISGIRQRYVDACLPPGLNCSALCERILTNLGAWPVERTRDTLEGTLKRLRKQGTGEGQDVKCRQDLAYLVLDRVGRSGLLTLLADPVGEPAAPARPRPT